jgi:hypothetical protein
LAAIEGPVHRWRPLLSEPTMRRRVRLATQEREQKGERTSRKSTNAKGASLRNVFHDERSLTRGAASQKDVQAADPGLIRSLRFLRAWREAHPKQRAAVDGPAAQGNAVRQHCSMSRAIKR